MIEGFGPEEPDPGDADLFEFGYGDTPGFPDGVNLRMVLTNPAELRRAVAGNWKAVGAQEQRGDRPSQRSRGGQTLGQYAALDSHAPAEATAFSTGEMKRIRGCADSMYSRQSSAFIHLVACRRCSRASCRVVFGPVRSSIAQVADVLNQIFERMNCNPSLNLERYRQPKVPKSALMGLKSFQLRLRNACESCPAFCG